ncbi:tyrosine phosphatase family-domain-containing protein [Blyttiomyces helicus]|uniref:Tyrosine phosphatase family-domain-containing protein n=1 Tax=Blyttiomyces helicus TaxID=388810 RepID=A0A4P9W8D5_9FUNG|nr:tyrosine phosphatase family-domain-containing protein [Blyttiomyces helicus]|eukprot:RKO88604.1 tyrosine phosphatase family-domain-containing protein [Blyttiomyces helicus]
MPSTYLKLTISNTAGERLVATFVDGNLPDGRGRHIVVVCHGFAAHKNFSFFPALAHALSFPSFRFDFRGAGESDGNFSWSGHLRWGDGRIGTSDGAHPIHATASQLPPYFTASLNPPQDDVQDIETVLSHLQARNWRPLALIGHSHDGNDVILHALKHPFAVRFLVNISGRTVVVAALEVMVVCFLAHTTRNMRLALSLPPALAGSFRFPDVEERQTGNLSGNREGWRKDGRRCRLPQERLANIPRTTRQEAIPLEDGAYLTNTRYDSYVALKDEMTSLPRFWTAHGEGRVVVIRGVPNFRDVGGRASSEWGRLIGLQSELYLCFVGSLWYRRGGGWEDGRVVNSKTPNPAITTFRALWPEGLLRLRSLGIAKIFDLRSEPKIVKNGNPDLTSSSILRVAATVFGNEDYSPAALAKRLKLYAGDAEGFAEAYMAILAAGRAAFAGIVRSLTENGPALVIHCTAGKDRTGVVVALLLKLCGVDDDLVVRDYAVT